VSDDCESDSAYRRSVLICGGGGVYEGGNVGHRKRIGGWEWCGEYIGFRIFSVGVWSFSCLVNDVVRLKSPPQILCVTGQLGAFSSVDPRGWRPPKMAKDFFFFFFFEKKYILKKNLIRWPHHH
jgi:hypothetical protein